MVYCSPKSPLCHVVQNVDYMHLYIWKENYSDLHPYEIKFCVIHKKSQNCVDHRNLDLCMWWIMLAYRIRTNVQGT